MLKRHTAVLAIVMAVAITPMLAGCFGNPLESVIEGATGGDVDLGGNTIPDGFPSDVPLFDGEILFGASIGNADAKVFNVTVKVPDMTAIDTIKGQLEDAGFAAAAGVGGASDQGATAIYANDAWGVLVVVSGDDTASFAANYTVTAGGNQ